MNQAHSTNSPLEEQKRPPRSLAEWVSFSIALLILAIVSGLVIYSWLTKSDEPPILAVDRTEAVKEIEGKYYVPFEVSNKGGETAESVQVVAELKINGEVEASGDFLIDFLSQNETEKGGFVFDKDPRQGELTVRVSSYKVP